MHSVTSWLVVLTTVTSLETAHFTLRSHLNPNLLDAVESAEEKSCTAILEDREPSKTAQLTLLELKPLYFHDDGMALEVSNMVLASSDMELLETNLDILGQRMMPVVIYQWIEVNGNLKINSSSNFKFRLMESKLRSKGIISLTENLTNVLWSYFYFVPNSFSVEIESLQKDVDKSIMNQLNSSQFSEILSQKLQRDISHQLSQMTSKQLNRTLNKTSKLTNLLPNSEELSDIRVNNTKNANLFIDNILKVGGLMIQSKYQDQLKLPDIKEGFSEKFLVTFRGSFYATDGAAIGISSVHRIGDVVFGYDNSSLLHFYGKLEFDVLHLYYGYYKAEMWGVGPTGTLDTVLTPVTVLVHVHLNSTSKTVTMEKFKISNVGDLKVKLSGLGGMFNWLVSRVTTWVVGLYRAEVLQLLESQYEQYGKEIFATYSLEELLNGGKNEAYVL